MRHVEERHRNRLVYEAYVLHAPTSARAKHTFWYSSTHYLETFLGQPRIVTARRTPNTFEKRLMTRPAGLESKNRMGDRMTWSSMSLCSLLADDVSSRMKAMARTLPTTSCSSAAHNTGQDGQSFTHDDDDNVASHDNRRIALPWTARGAGSPATASSRAGHWVRGCPTVPATTSRT